MNVATSKGDYYLWFSKDTKGHGCPLGTGLKTRVTLPMVMDTDSANLNPVTCPTLEQDEITDSQSECKHLNANVLISSYRTLISLEGYVNALYERCEYITPYHQPFSLSFPPLTLLSLHGQHS